MKSFLQFIVEKNLAKTAILASSLALSGDNATKDGTTQLPPQQETAVAAQTEQPADPYEYFGGEHNKKLYRAIISAEYRGRNIGDPLAYNKNLYTRTSAIPPKTKNKKGQLVQLTSSAYGPGQITMGTVSGMRKNKATADLFTGIPEEYLNSFEAQGKQMIKAGNVKGGEFGLGGCGTLCGEEHHQNYQKMAVAVMRGKMRELGIDDTKELSAEDQIKFAKGWAAEHWSSDYQKAFTQGYEPPKPVEQPKTKSP